MESAGAMVQPVSDLRLCFSLRGMGQTLLSAASPLPHKAAHWGVSAHLQPPKCSVSRFSHLIWHKRGHQILIFRKLSHSLPPFAACPPTHIQCSQQRPSLAPGCSSHILYSSGSCKNSLCAVQQKPVTSLYTQHRRAVF